MPATTAAGAPEASMNASTPNRRRLSTVGSSTAVAPNVRACLRRDSSGSLTDDFGRAVGAGELSHHDADRSRTGDRAPATRRRRLPCEPRRCRPTTAHTARRRRRRPCRAPGGRTPRRWSRNRTARRRPAGWRRTACAGTGCSGRAGSPRCRDRAAAVRSTPADRCARGRPTRRRRRSSPPLRGRAPTAASTTKLPTRPCR